MSMGNNGLKMNHKMADKYENKWVKNGLKIINDWRTPFVLLWLFLTVCHLLFTTGTADDAAYAQILNEKSLLDHLVDAYKHWSARTLVDIGLVVINWLPPLVWKLANPLLMVASAYSLTVIAGTARRAAGSWLVCGGLLLYPWQLMASAGWITTTTAFVWPGAAWLGALAVLARACRAETRACRGEKPKAVWCALSLPAMLYAVCMEQITVMTIFLLGALLVWQLATKKRVQWLVAAQLGIAAAGAVWIALSPGPKARFVGEMTSWYPNFEMKSVISKLELGLSAALDDVFFSRNILFFVFCLLLCWAVWARNKQALYRVLGAVPLGVCAVLGMYQKYTLAVAPGLCFFTEALQAEGMVTLVNCNTLTAYIPLVALYGSLAVCVVDVYLALGHTPKALFCLYGLACGLGSRVMLGFSPTIWVSGARTGYFFNLAVLAVCAVLFDGVKTEKGPRRAVFVVVFAAYVLLQAYSFQQMRIATGY